MESGYIREKPEYPSRSEAPDFGPAKGIGPKTGTLLLKIEGPDTAVPSIKIDCLHEDWRSQLELTRNLGTAWLEKNECVLLLVPSAIVPEIANYLFNPSHKQVLKFRIANVSAVLLSHWGRTPTLIPSWSIR